MDLVFAIVGFVAGIAVGLTSMGGGSILTSALVLMGVPPSVAVGSDVLIASGMKLFGGGVYAIRRQVHWPTVAMLSAGSVPGAAIGVVVLNRFISPATESVLSRVIGLTLIAAGTATVVRLVLARRKSPERAPGSASTAALGFVTGMLVATTSVGSGSVLLCVLAILYPLRSQTLVGTDLVHALVLSAVATVGHLFAGRVDFALAGAVLLGAVPGVLIGARLANVVPERALRVGLAVVLVAVGVHLSVLGAPTEHRSPAAGPP